MIKLLYINYEKTIYRGNYLLLKISTMLNILSAVTLLYSIYLLLLKR